MDLNEDVAHRSYVSFVALGLSSIYYIIALPFQACFTAKPRPEDFAISYVVDAITISAVCKELLLHRRGGHASGGFVKLVLLLATAIPWDALLWSFPSLWAAVPFVRLVRLVHGEQLVAYLSLLDHALVISYTKVKLVKLILFTLWAANVRRGQPPNSCATPFIPSG